MSELDRIKTVMPEIDKISPSFCLAKWHHVTIYLQTGETHSCYHPAPHKIPLEGLIDNPSQLHNTPQKKLERKEMLAGLKPSGCQYCWNIECMGKDYISDRHIKTASIHTPERIEEITSNPWDYNINPEYIEVNFSNECNFKCGYCHPKFSSRYWNEIKQHGPYKDSTAHRNDIDWIELYEEESNPYVEAWWKWWPEVSKTLNILRVTGGEPLMHKSTWRLFEELKSNPKPHLNIELNSNMGVKPALVKKLTQVVKELRETNCIASFKLYTSIDTWSNRAEYTRTGLDLKIWETNLDYYLSNTPWPVTFMITFNIFSVTSFSSLLEKILEWRKKYNTDEQTKWQRIRFDTPYLTDPIQFDINILPKDEFMPYMKKHLEFIVNNLDDTNRTKFSSLEYERFRRVVDYMETTNYSEKKLLNGRKNFHTWFREYDKRRNTNLVETFPEFKEFYNFCKTC
jgi:hypothetical protein